MGIHSPAAKTARILALATLFLAPLSAQQPSQVEPAPLELKFGLYSFKKPTDVYRAFLAAIEDLDRSLDKKLGQPVTVQIKVYKTYEECLDHFVGGDVDFVRFGPSSYVLAREREAKIQLLVAEKEDFDDGLSGVIAVRSNSPIKSLADLRGRRFAFGDENSTIGRYLSQAQLVSAGIYGRDLGKFDYLQRHDKVFKAVEIGDFDAGALHYAIYLENNKKGQLRELARFQNVGKAWVARAGLDPRMVEALRQSLLGMKDQKALDALSVTGFVAAADKDFDVIREGMKKSQEFLQPAATPTPAPPAAPPQGKD